MKKLTLAALIFAATIANAETINPKSEVLFDKCVSIDVQAMYDHMSEHVEILTTGIEWLDKELLLNSGLFKNNQGKTIIPSSNKSFAELKKQLKQQYEKEFNDFSVYIDDKEVKQPKKYGTSGECDEGYSGHFETKFIKQNGDTVIFVTYDTNTGHNGHGGETRREIHFDLKTKKRTHLQGWSKCWYGCNWTELSKEELGE